jgi:putative transcriptional regulator
MKVSIHLQQLLTSRNMSQRELERRTDIKQPTINKMCQDTLQHFPLDSLAKICEVLECDISDVLKLNREDESDANS